MLEGAIKLVTIRGIEIRLDYSWFVIFALVTYSLAAHQYPMEWPLAVRIALGLVTSLLFFLSVLLHELAHSFVAQMHGIKVPRITLFIFGGAAQIAEEPKSAGDEFLMAAAGPAMSVVLSIFCGLLYFLFAYLRLTPLAALFEYLALINLSLAIFNLIPGFPLDGGRVLRSMIWGASKDLNKSTRIAAVVGQVVAVMFIALGALALVQFESVFNGIWIAFIGLFLLRAARQTLARLNLQNSLAGHYANELMWGNCTFIEPDTPLSVLFHQQIVRAGRRCFPVMDQGRVVGLVGVDNVRAVPPAAWPMTRARDVMVRAEAINPIAPETPLGKVLDLMARDGIYYFPVVKDGIFLGVVAREALEEFIRAKNVGKRPWAF
jgi:Zn-dependent protease